MNQESLQTSLIDLPIPALYYKESTTSTNSDALELLEHGASDSTLIVANHQTAGRGRLDRKWITYPDSALAFSIIFRLIAKEVPSQPLFSPLGSLAVCQAIQQNYKIDAQVKWPNDVIVNRKKICGVLAESYWEESYLSGIVLGIGVNIARDSLPSPDQLMFPATSLESEIGKSVKREDVLVCILTNLLSLRQKIRTKFFFDYWDSCLAFKNEKIILKKNDNIAVIGTLKGINRNGDLILALESGNEKTFQIGDVKLRPQFH